MVIIPQKLTPVNYRMNGLYIRYVIGTPITATATIIQKAAIPYSVSSSLTS